MNKSKGFTPLRRKASCGEMRISNGAKSPLVRSPGDASRRKRFPTGFTLVELLVVISIIALLMAILMPALARVKDQAKAVACKSNLHQWGLILSMYTEDHDGHFHQGWTSSPGPKSLWMDAWLPYYKDVTLRLCPSATKPYTEGGSVPFGAWGVHKPNSSEGGKVGGSGSYGINGWVNHPQGTPAAGRDPKKYWRTVNVSGTSQIPVFLDASWARIYVLHDNEPPEYPGDVTITRSNRTMKHFCLNRHNEYVNGLFLDFAVQKVGLKQLWTLKWHRNWERDAAGNYDPSPWTLAGGVTRADWLRDAPWMVNFKDY